ncbi:c-type cytochrome [Hymenobacter cellulosilyticus]|uniref:Cytochrome c n=1 Tax=Hymenobacter cellulosilyticus TaxID=2932248 RepID=A0A8T9PZE2_9BACT|nr:c-type cytochrome [Hymenobacter cellulosilyticus]UOQ70594.1 cytochrome c [Hymenobacter cellulosilyticus]
MRKFFKYLGMTLGLATLAVAGFAVYVAAQGIPTYDLPKAPALTASTATPAQLALGEKLVLSDCADCHLNKQTNALSGQKLADIPTEFGNVYSANITQDKTHGIGSWTDAEVVTLLRTGIGRDGRYRLIMPKFVKMSDEDVRSIVAYLRSDQPWIRPNATPTPQQQPSFLLKALTHTVMKPTPMPTAAINTPAAQDQVAYGKYLVVGRYACYECHSKDFKSNNALEPEKSEGYLGGGNAMLNLQGQTVLSRNLTADPETGLGDWSEEQFSQAVQYGLSPRGGLKYPMPKYTRMSDEEVRAIFAYLQTVPKIRNATPEDAAEVAVR